jgi:5,5'-dehydrodivanillate O-demethylase
LVQGFANESCLDGAADYSDFVHTGPGTLAGRFLRRFWQPIYRAEDLLPGYAKPIKIMSEDYTLYRGESGVSHLVAFRCAHRGTQLSTGWVEGDCIRCFYHGWKYDGAGQCVEMPAEDPSFPPRVKIKSYPTAEYLGIIFGFLGEGATRDTTSVAALPLPRFPELEGSGVLDVRTSIWPSNYFQGIENNVDQTHLAWVHRESVFDANGLVETPALTAEETDYGIRSTGTRQGKVRVTHWYMPNTNQLKLPPTSALTGWMDLLIWGVPVDDTHTQRFRVTFVAMSEPEMHEYRARQQSREEWSAAAAAAGDAIIAGQRRTDDIPFPPGIRVNVQDYVAQVGQGIIADREHERLGRGDQGVILLRKLWARELRALAEGRPLKAWARPERLEATTGL